jgi:hypothetical protein
MALYACTIFISAFLLFQIQPMITKIILPSFGGSAAVWITAMLFFQVMLLGGYLYAHWFVRSSRPKLQTGLHVILLLGSLALLPVWPDLAWKPNGSQQPMLRVLCLLSLSVGLPYFLLSTTSPLIQAWYSEKHRKGLPYRLFALSNLASLLGLVAYPFLIEPNVTLREQSFWWSSGYALYAALCAALAIGAKKGRSEQPATAASGPDDLNAPMPVRQQLLCLVLACSASTIMLAVTNHLTQNVAAIPFLWVLPLGIYLLSFVLTFDLESLYHHKIFLWLTALALAGMSLALLSWTAREDIRIVIALFCVGLLICCIFCHGEIVKRKPGPRYLTSFYLTLSAGGALGGLLIGVIAPLALPGSFELPIALGGCAVLTFLTGYGTSGRFTKAVCAAAAVVAIYSNARYVASYLSSVQLMSRNFYGSLRVMACDQGRRDESRILFHGAIVHGKQFTEPVRRHQAQLYYRSQSGVGRALQALRDRRPSRLKVGVIGLGTGSLAAYAREGDLFRFYEINPLVEEVARKEFSYLAECRGNLDVVIGDGRLAMEGERPQRYDLLVVDAFSGDAIPVHLLSLQALRFFFEHVEPEGFLALHITNTHLDLEPVVDGISKALGKHAVVISDRGSDGREISRWALISAGPIKAPVVANVAAQLRSRPELAVWTDDYNNLFQILK